jgi:hypothetical protein
VGHTYAGTDLTIGASEGILMSMWRGAPSPAVGAAASASLFRGLTPSAARAHTATTSPGGRTCLCHPDGVALGGATCTALPEP